MGLRQQNLAADRNGVPSRRRRWWGRVFLLLLAPLIVDQFVQWAILGRDGRVGELRYPPYDPPLFNAEQVQQLKRYEELATRARRIVGAIAEHASR